MVDFSVLMSVYHKEAPKSLDNALESVLKQSLKPSEILLVKDGPLTEELENVIQKHQTENPKMIKEFSLKENVGLGNALKKGVLECSNEIILRMDTDDICFPDRFEKQIKFMMQNPEFDVVGGWIVEFKNNLNYNKAHRKVPEYDNMIKTFHKKRNAINHMTVGFKKSKVLEAGNYEDLPFFEDYFLWAKMMQKKMMFYNIQECLVYARIGNDMIGRRHGLSYVKKEYNCYNQLYKIGFISKFELIKVLILRLPIRILPKFILSRVYNFLIRT